MCQNECQGFQRGNIRIGFFKNINRDLVSLGDNTENGFNKMQHH